MRPGWEESDNGSSLLLPTVQPKGDCQHGSASCYSARPFNMVQDCLILLLRTITMVQGTISRLNNAYSEYPTNYLLASWWRAFG